MNKSELIASIAENTGLSKAAATRSLNAFIDGVTGALGKGESVTLIGFGTFSVNERSARQGRNPQTGKAMKIAAKKVARFKVGSKLKEAVN